MRKLTYEEFCELKRAIAGRITISPMTDCTECYFDGIDNVDFGYGCSFGSGCNFGKSCTFGNKCKFGNWCKFGVGCKFGENCTFGEGINVHATFEDGRVQDGLYVQIGNIGSEHRTAYFYIDKDGAMFVRAGCWFGEIEDFKVRVRRIYEDTVYEAQYMAACAYAEAVLPLMLKESDAKREKEQQYEN